MEEDLPKGAEEIICYLLGPSPEREDVFSFQSEEQKEWNLRLERFLTGKDKVGLSGKPSRLIAVY